MIPYHYTHIADNVGLSTPHQPLMLQPLDESFRMFDLRPNHLLFIFTIHFVVRESAFLNRWGHVLRVYTDYLFSIQVNCLCPMKTSIVRTEGYPPLKINKLNKKSPWSFKIWINKKITYNQEPMEKRMRTAAFKNIHSVYMSREPIPQNSTNYIHY